MYMTVKQILPVLILSTLEMAYLNDHPTMFSLVCRATTIRTLRSPWHIINIISTAYANFVYFAHITMV